MAKLSGNYEVVFILNPNLDEEATAAKVLPIPATALFRRTATA